MGVFKLIEPLNSISLEVYGSNLYPKRSEEEDGQLAMARSPIVPDHLQGDGRLWPGDDWLRPRAPTQGVADYRAMLATRP
ncbi:hypothetical protein B296_00037519 [Ensete ventricosum]|uniref:Uncharacterized protein n=1 Tax=Ensete ventricosum TaxID=4639 RepID=A0A426X338_ENSVE|nr:hypothetical protein B296_00037519 [Ensete ventricosum]